MYVHCSFIGFKISRETLWCLLVHIERLQSHSSSSYFSLLRPHSQCRCRWLAVLHMSPACVTALLNWAVVCSCINGGGLQPAGFITALLWGPLILLGRCSVHERTRKASIAPSLTSRHEKRGQDWVRARCWPCGKHDTCSGFSLQLSWSLYVAQNTIDTLECLLIVKFYLFPVNVIRLE